MKTWHVVPFGSDGPVAPAGSRSGPDAKREQPCGGIDPLRRAQLRDAIAKVQAEVRRHVPAGADLADELERDRRAEAALE